MVARVNTVAFQGIDVVDVDVQVQISPGMPAFTVVGLPDKAPIGTYVTKTSVKTHLAFAVPVQGFQSSFALAGMLASPIPRAFLS